MGTYVCMTLLYGEESQIVHACTYKQVPYSGLFSRRLYFANSQFNSCSRKVISRMEILNHHTSSHINYLSRFFFRRLALLSRNSRNINASKITRYTVYTYGDFVLLACLQFPALFTITKFGLCVCVPEG